MSIRHNEDGTMIQLGTALEILRSAWSRNAWSTVSALCGSDWAAHVCGAPTLDDAEAAIRRVGYPNENRD